MLDLYIMYIFIGTKVNHTSLKNIGGKSNLYVAGPNKRMNIFTLPIDSRKIPNILKTPYNIFNSR